MVYIAVMKNGQSANVGTVRERVRAQRRSAYALLSALYKKIYRTELPAISREEGGKPYFEGNGMPSFSISHTEGACLAAIDTDGGGIGADIQMKIADTVANRVGKRFPFVERTECGAPLSGTVIFEGRAAGEGLALFPYSLNEYAKQSCEAFSFSAKWALTEALLKADGGGFRSAGKLDKLRSYESVSLVFEDDYFISVVKLT